MKDKRTVANDLEQRIQMYIQHGAETRIESVRRYYAPLTIKRALEAVGFTDILFTKTYQVNSFKDTLPEARLTKSFLVKATQRLS